MSQKKKVEMDVYGKLVDAANKARCNGTTPAQAEAFCQMLAGNPPPRRLHVGLSMETPWVEVPMVAISSEGDVAVLGIGPNGEKEIFEATVIGRRWTSRVVYSTDEEARIDHLHYPEGRSDVAFSVTRPDGRTRIFWGDWHFEVESQPDFIYLFERPGDDQRHAVVVYTRVETQHADLFIEGNGMFHPFHGRDIVMGQELKVLGVFGDHIAIKVADRDAQQMLLVGHPVCDETWRSDWYDQILPESAMERDGEFSFVGWNDESPEAATYTGQAWLIFQDRQQYLGEALDADEIVCLPSGRILIEEWEDGRVLGLGNEDALVRAQDTLFLRDVDTNERIELSGVKKIKEIVEMDGDIAVLGTQHQSGLCLLIFHQREDGSWFDPTGFPVLGAQNLRSWGGRLVYGEVSEAGDLVLRVLFWALEPSSETPNKFSVVAMSAVDFPLNSPSKPIVLTEEGAMISCFDAGTLTIYRYPL